MVRLGLDLPPELLALACASHSGEPFHLDGVRRILASAGPRRVGAADAARLPARRRRAATPSSGPAASATLAPDELLGQARRDARDLRRQRLGHRAPTSSPTTRSRPAIRATFEELTGEPVGRGRRRRLRRAAAVDVADRPRRARSGAWPSPRTAPSAGSPRRSARTRSASPAPAATSATLLTAIPGAIGKAGAEACYAVALPDGRAFALKIDDGARSRAAGRDGGRAAAGPASTGRPGSTATPYAAPGDAPLLGGAGAGRGDPRRLCDTLRRVTRRALITGITGQDGSYLAELLLAKGYEVHGLRRRSSTFNSARIEHLYQDPRDPDTRLFFHYADLTDESRLIRLLRRIQPDEVYNLAGQSHVGVELRRAGVHRRHRRARGGPPARGDPHRRARLPLLPGVQLGDVRHGAGAAATRTRRSGRPRRTAPRSSTPTARPPSTARATACTRSAASSSTTSHRDAARRS